MKDIVEIRWHGRGGQGAKTASLLLAEAAFNTGKNVQGFPEYGPERMGAPITAYNRVSKDPIRVHCNIYNPNYVAVVDETLLATVDVTSGLDDNGVVIVNTTKTPEEVKKSLKGYKGRVCTVDATGIARETIGGNFPNTPMLAAVVKVSHVMDEDELVKDMTRSFEHKFASKPQVIKGNLEALSRGLTEVVGE